MWDIGHNILVSGGKISQALLMRRTRTPLPELEQHDLTANYIMININTELYFCQSRARWSL
jgi:hypothetical protein